MDVITRHAPTPIPMRDFDWSAFTSEHDIGHPIGQGPTEGDAVRDLVEKLADEDDRDGAAFEIGQTVTAFKTATRVEASNPRPDGQTTYRVEGVEGWLRRDELSAGAPTFIGIYAWSSLAPGSDSDARPDEFVVLSHPTDGSRKSIAKARSTVEADIDGADRPFTLIAWAVVGDQELSDVAGAASTSHAPAGQGAATSTWIGPLSKIGAIAPLARNRIS